MLFISYGHSQTTLIPDSDFERALVVQGYDDIIDGSVLTSSIDTITSFSMKGELIGTLAGIEDFIALKSLSLGDVIEIDLTNNIDLEFLSIDDLSGIDLDLTKNIVLKDLRIGTGTLTSLDLTKNTVLQNILIMSFRITSLDLTNNVDLLKLAINSPLTSLDLSQLSNLNWLSIGFSYLTDIDLSNNSSLGFVDIISNETLTNLNVSNNKLLEHLHCANNDNLSKLYLGNNIYSSLNHFNVKGNPKLLCIQVSDVDWWTSNWKNSIDSFASFSQDCGYTLSIDDDFLSQNLTIYPNPFSNIISINSEVQLTKVEFYSILGRKVKEIDSNFNFISTTNLFNGLYLVRIHSENGLATKKLIKN